MKKIMLGIAALMGMVGIATATEITWEGLCKNVLHPLRDNSGDPAQKFRTTSERSKRKQTVSARC